MLFDYQKTRGREGPDELFKNFTGYLQTDGYAAYEHFEKQKGITLLACMAHARRKFEHALDNNPVLADKALKMFRELYKIEEEARVRNLAQEDIKELRQKESKTVLINLEQWLREQVSETLPKSAI